MDQLFLLLQQTKKNTRHSSTTFSPEQIECKETKMISEFATLNLSSFGEKGQKEQICFSVSLSWQENRCKDKTTWQTARLKKKSKKFERLST